MHDWVGGLLSAELKLLAYCYQIHLFDDGSETDLGDAWTDEAVLDSIAVAAEPWLLPRPSTSVWR